MKKDEKKIINEYISLCEEKDQFYIDFDYKKHNRIARKLLALDKILKKELVLAYTVVDELMKHDGTSLGIWINELSVDIDYRKNEAIANLLDLEKKNSNNLYSIDIKSFLSENGIIEWLNQNQ